VELERVFAIYGTDILTYISEVYRFQESEKQKKILDPESNPYMCNLKI